MTDTNNPSSGGNGEAAPVAAPQDAMDALADILDEPATENGQEKAKTPRDPILDDPEDDQAEDDSDETSQAEAKAGTRDEATPDRRSPER